MLISMLGKEHMCHITDVVELVYLHAFNSEMLCYQAGQEHINPARSSWWQTLQTGGGAMELYCVT